MRRRLALALGLSSGALLAYNTALRPDASLEDLRAPRRYWEDVAIGASQYLQRGAAVPTVPIGSAPATDLRHALRRYILKAAAADGIRPWEFWRTVRIKPSLKRERIVPRDYDDPGRPALIGLGFRLAGGVAPYLGLWLGALLTVPVLLWSAWELIAANRPLAAALLPFLLAAWAHLVDLLALPYSAAGFYLLALLVLANLAVYALLGSSRSTSGLVLRLLAAGAGFALCVACRGSVMLLLPGFLLVVLLAVRRVLGTGARWRGGLLAAGVVVFLLPYVLTRQQKHHAVWGDIWQGLGDFDTAKGHVWSDPALRALLRQEGMRLHRNVGVEFESDESERITRRIVLTHIREDPPWLATILVKRLGVTLTQRKLWAWEPRDGRTYYPTTRINEGTVDRYYNMAATADVFGLGPWRREIPMGLLTVPAWLPCLLGLAGLGSARLRSWRERFAPPAGVVACVALAAATLPVAIMTGALEMQAFVVVYLIGLALTVQALLPPR